MLAMEKQNQLTLFSEYPGNKSNRWDRRKHNELYTHHRQRETHGHTIVNFPIYNLSKQNQQLNESHAIIKNPVFDTHP
jgi:hypothetical protein